MLLPVPEGAKGSNQTKLSILAPVRKSVKLGEQSFRGAFECPKKHRDQQNLPKLPIRLQSRRTADRFTGMRPQMGQMVPGVGGHERRPRSRIARGVVSGIRKMRSARLAART